jgi:hypothetical protein
MASPRAAAARAMEADELRIAPIPETLTLIPGSLEPRTKAALLTGGQRSDDRTLPVTEYGVQYCAIRPEGGGGV